MEYDINNKIKYTTLHIRSMLVWKGIIKKEQKGHWRKSPQGGWGMGSKETIQKIFLFNNGYNIKELI